MCLFLWLTGCGGPVPEKPIPEETARAAALLGRGMNLGNALEAPVEGEWGVTIQSTMFQHLREAKFQSVRIPVRWSAHVSMSPPYTISSDFFLRMDQVIQQALENGLAVVINDHHDDALYEEPEKHQERYLATWKQIATRYRDKPLMLYFEPLNEPHGNLQGERWNQMIPRVLEVIRSVDTKRFVILGPGEYNHVSQLQALRLPDTDQRLIVTIHHYEPFHFTHQGTPWNEGSDAWLGQTWDAREDEKTAISSVFSQASAWGREQGRPIYLGEFGAYEKADLASRVRWTSFVAREAERFGMSWAYWELAAGFGVYDQTQGTWKDELLRALIPLE
ncbi:MAG: glycoside hydrolase family 5 protein [Myxococcales bacterium]|nr:glycoside hydrolase family 5 protein [Myxococcales bacterium]